MTFSMLLDLDLTCTPGQETIHDRAVAGILEHPYKRSSIMLALSSIEGFSPVKLSAQRGDPNPLLSLPAIPISRSSRFSCNLPFRS